MADELQEKQDIVLMTRLTNFQRTLLSTFLSQSLKNPSLTKTGKIKVSFLKTFVVCSRICNHPDLIYNILKSGDKDEELESELLKEKLTYDWAKPLFRGYEANDIMNSNKMEILFKIIATAERLNDKMVVFSQWVFTLDLIEHFLKSVKGWRRGRNYVRFDGQTKQTERNSMIKDFNDDPEIRLFLISTKAGGEGINLKAANRAVIFDASWNPSWDTQASCRIFRIGQVLNKFYIYFNILFNF